MSLSLLFSTFAAASSVVVDSVVVGGTSVVMGVGAAASSVVTDSVVVGGASVVVGVVSLAVGGASVVMGVVSLGADRASVVMGVVSLGAGGPSIVVGIFSIFSVVGTSVVVSVCEFSVGLGCCGGGGEGDFGGSMPSFFITTSLIRAAHVYTCM